MKTVIVTGGCGFIGSNFIHYLVKNHPDYRIVNIDKLTYAGNPNNLESIKNHPGYFFEKCDISDRTGINRIFRKYNPDFIVNFAAESHVDRSILYPDLFIDSNIKGTQVLLDEARKLWLENGSYRKGVRFHQVSTDEVYGALGKTGFFTESTPLSPNSPYSASKASADMICRAYSRTFGLPVTISRCSNNYGPYQFPEKLIPLMISNCLNNKKLPVYGDGMQIRDWLYVEDHCSAIDTILHRGKDGEVYNIGGNNEKANLEIVHLIIEKTGKDESLIEHVTDRPGHDRRYAIDNSKITAELGWKPAYTFDEGIESTINWYLGNQSWINRILSGKYQEES